MKTQQITIRLPEDAIMLLDAAAKAEDRSRAYILTRLARSLTRAPAPAITPAHEQGTKP